MKAECVVCWKRFNARKGKPVVFTGLPIWEEMFCSDKCFKTYLETMLNKKTACIYCGKKPKSKNTVTWKVDYKKKVLVPVCMTCYKENYNL